MAATIFYFSVQGQPLCGRRWSSRRAIGSSSAGRSCLASDTNASNPKTRRINPMGAIAHFIASALARSDLVQPGPKNGDL
jgi:hypothetical protein